MGTDSKLMRALTRATHDCPRCWKPSPLGSTFCLGCGEPLSPLETVEDSDVLAVESAEPAFRDGSPGEARGPRTRRRSSSGARIAAHRF